MAEKETVRQGPPKRGPMARMNVAEKPKSMKKAVGNLFAYGKKYRFAFLAVFLLSVVAAVLAILGPNLVKKVTNAILDGVRSPAGIDIAETVKLCVILTVMYGSALVFGYVQGFIMATVTQRISKGLRTDISHKIDRMPLRYFDTTSYGDTLSRVTNDVDLIEITMNRSVGNLLGSVTQFLGSVVMMFLTNYILAFAAIVTSLVGFFAMGIIVKKSQKFFLRQQQELGAINGKIEETFSAHNIVKAYGAEEKEKRAFDKINTRLRGASWKAQFLSGLMMPFMAFVGDLGFVVVAVLGGAMAVKGTVSFGVVIAFIMYVHLFTEPLTQLANSVSSLQSAAAASERVFDFLENEELDDESGKTAYLPTAEGHVVFENVHFGYDKSREIIHGFSADVLPGQKVAIVGPTGAGKTTVVNLLMRFYEPDSGKIYVDGVDISTLTRENVRDLFGMVLQDTWLFHGTIRENIAYGKKDATDEEVAKAAQAVGLHHYITTLPKGYDTVLDGNVSLSVGQKQLMTIARAIVENAPLLILDEATSSVDTRTELLIQRAMDALTAERTSFVIAHRLSTIKNADLILVLKDGSIVEQGTHAELLARGGAYAELYNSQFN